MSITCPKIEHLDLASLERIVGREIEDIAPVFQFLDTAVISGLRTYLGQVHGLFPVDMEGITEQLEVPQLEQGHVKADVGRVQTAVPGKPAKYPIEMFDVIDVLQNLNPFMDLVLFQDLHDLMVFIIQHTTDLGKWQGPVRSSNFEGFRVISREVP